MIAKSEQDDLVNRAGLPIKKASEGGSHRTVQVIPLLFQSIYAARRCSAFTLGELHVGSQRHHELAGTGNRTL